MKTFDPALVEEAFEEDVEGLAFFLRSVTASLDTSYERARAAVAQGNATALRAAAHSIKGSSGHLGGARVADLAGRIEIAARDGKIESEAMFGQLATAIHELQANVEQYIAGRTSA